MNRKTAVLALLLLGGCHHGTSAGTTARASRPTPTAPAVTPVAQSAAPTGTQVALAPPTQTAPEEATLPPAYAAATPPPAPTSAAPVDTAAPRQREIVEAYPTTGGTVSTPTLPMREATAASPSAANTHGATPSEATSAARPIPNLSACEGLSDAQITRPVFDNAISMRTLTRHVGKQRAVVASGVAVRVPAEEGRNAGYVQRIVNCQTAQARASGSTDSPLAIEGTHSRVSHRHGATEIRLTNADPARAREIERRVESDHFPSAH